MPDPREQERLLSRPAGGTMKSSTKRPRSDWNRPGPGTEGVTSMQQQTIAPALPDGYEAMGKPIPVARMSVAYRAVKSMIPGVSTEDAMTLVGRVAGALERDEPYEALRLATGAPIGKDAHTAHAPEPAASDMPPVLLDATGGYRLMAHLLTNPGGES